MPDTQRHLPADPSITLSFEFFPPKTDAGSEKLWHAVQHLSSLRPQFVSVTCGAGGSAIEGTSSIVNHIQKKFGIETAPHVAIARQSRSRVRDALHAYKNAGVKRIVAIRGDEAQAPAEDFKDDIYPNTVDFVAELHGEFALAPIVAAYPDVHPGALSPQQDLDHLRRKEAAGAALAVSQFFFEADTFLRFRDKMRAAGMKLPLAPGIMPIQNLTQTVKFANGCGTSVPAGFGTRFERHGENETAAFQEGVAHAIELCDQLRREGVHHFHFYTLNRCEMTQAICKNLGLSVPV